jgi:hypothetical protein
MIDCDIWIAANEMIKLYGDDAILIAAMRADTLGQQDDAEGYTTSKRVAAAIRELRDTESTGVPN